MYSKEEFDKEKTKVLKYILYKKRSEYEIRNKFSKSIEENLLDDCSLNLALQKLDKKERLLIQLRYFDGYTQQEVAQRLFISQVQVSRLEKRILEKLKINI